MAAISTAGLLSTAAPFMATTAYAQASENVQTMTVSRLDQILQSEIGNIDGENGQWRFSVNGRSVVVLADARNDRMRIVSPVIPVSDLTPQQVQSILAANFHTALDARYAVTEGAVVAVYLHPLGTLQDNDFRSALRQVVSLAETFGESYSSNELNFGLRQERQPRGIDEI